MDSVDAMFRFDSLFVATALFALLGCDKHESGGNHRQLCLATRQALGTGGAGGHADEALKALVDAEAPGSCAAYNQSIIRGRALITGFKLGVLAWRDESEVNGILDALRIRDTRWTRSADEELGGLALECTDRLVEIPEGKRNEIATSLRSVVVQLETAVAACPVDPRDLQSTGAK